MTNGRRLLSLAAREADIVGFTGLGHQRGGAEVEVSGFKPKAIDQRVAPILACRHGGPDHPKLRAGRERWGFSYYVVFEPMMDTFAPVVARLAGA